MIIQTNDKGISILVSESNFAKSNLSSESLFDAFTHAPVAMAIILVNGTIVEVNDKFSSMLTRSSAELKGLNLFQYCDYLPQGYANDQARDGERLTTDRNFSSTLTWADKHGKLSQFRITITAIGSSSQQQLLLSASEPTAVEHEFERFYYLASHDLQEPLRKITAFVNALKRRLNKITDNKDAAYELDRLDNAARRMSSMLKSLLLFSRSPNHYAAKQRCSLSELLDAATQEVAALGSKVSHEIVLIQDGSLTVDFDAMKWVFKNLLANCFIHASSVEHLRIKLDCESAGDWVRITVDDNGPGVPFDLLQEIFTPLSRFCDKSIAGDGMGLALCQKIVQAHGGRIRSERNVEKSQNDRLSARNGLRIMIELPNLQTAPAAEKPEDDV